MLALRNAAFSSGIFLAKSGAIEFVENASNILEAAGFQDKNFAIEAASLIIRIGFGISTAPLDNALTKLSSGEMSFAEFRKLETSEQFSFRGAAARTAFVLCAFFTIVYGTQTGEFIKEAFEESPLFLKTLEAMTRGCEAHHKLKTGTSLYEYEVFDETKSEDVLSVLMKFIGSEAQDEREEANSIQLLKFLLGDSDSDKSISKLKEAKNFLDVVLDYIEKNPGLFAGIGREDSDILKQKPSANPSEVKAQTPESKGPKSSEK